MRWVARALWRLGQGAFAAAATDYLSVVSGCVRGIQATGAARAWDAEVVGRGVARAGCPGVFGETRWRGRLGYKRLHRCSNLIIWAVLHLRLQHQTAAAAPWRDANGVGELPGRRHHQLAGAAAEGMAIGMSAAPLRMFAARRAASCCLTFSFCYLTSFFAHGELSASFGFFFFLLLLLRPMQHHTGPATTSSPMQSPAVRVCPDNCPCGLVLPAPTVDVLRRLVTELPGQIARALLPSVRRVH